MMDVEVDVLIVGGGIQGLMTLRRCIDAGWRNVALVTRDALGHGETLHSHGYDLAGYLLGPGADDFVEPFTSSSVWWRDWTADHGVTCDDSHPTFVGGTDEFVAERVKLWTDRGLTFDEQPEVPSALAEGIYSDPGHRICGTKNRRMSPWKIVDALAAPLQEHIIRGELVEVRLDETTNRIDGCSVSIDGTERGFRPKVLLFAAGRDNQTLLRGITDSNGTEVFRERLAGFHRVRDIPMLLIRGPLPQFSGYFFDLPIAVISHTDDERQPMWIVTVLDGHTTTGEDIDTGEEPSVGAGLVSDTMKKLHALVPSVQANQHDYEYSVYVGKKIDHPQDKPTWYLGDLGVANLRFVWPVFWTMSETASSGVISNLRASDDTAAFAAGKPFDGAEHGIVTGAVVGEERRRSPVQEWYGWDEFRDRYIG
jgi:hypothetical protein